MRTADGAATGQHDGGDMLAGGPTASVTATPDTDALIARLSPEHLQMLTDVHRLQQLGLLHLFPVGAGKTPKGQGQWRKGQTDYATVPMLLREWGDRLATGQPQGVAVIANRETGVVVLDVEKPGMQETMIQAALQTLPESCQVATFSGGRHAYLIVEGDYPDHGKDLAAHPPPEGKTSKVLLAEARLAPNYAVIVGPGRPPLRPDFTPHRISRQDYDHVVSMVRNAGTFTPTPPERKPYSGDGSGGGTGSIVTDAVAAGSLSALAVLPDGWRIAGHGRDGRVHVVRPDTDSDTSGNVLSGVVVIHSTSVDWAPQPTDPTKSAVGVSAADCLALSRHGGDYNAAMQWVEKVAADYVDDGLMPPPYWADALDVLQEVYDGRLRDLADYRAKKEAEELAEFTPGDDRDSGPATDRDSGPANDQPEPAPEQTMPPPAVTRRQVHDVFALWFGRHFDHQYLDTVLAVAVSGLHLDGDPCWLQVIGGAGVGKTEVTTSLSEAGCQVVSTVSGESALLSGTSAKSRAKNATGGLLRQIGQRGTLVVKDFTTILSLHREKRAEVLAALREVYDGSWSRILGVDGGQTLTWQGRLTVISCVTGVYDDHHSVIASMGDRFLLLRLDSDEKDMRRHATRRAISNVGSEADMRQQMGQAVAGFLRHLQVPEHLAPDDDTAGQIVILGDLVARARSQVSTDFKGEPEYAHAAEMPTRISKQLAQLWRGATACGLSDAEALAMVQRVAADSVPPDRRQVIDAVARVREPSSKDIASVTGMSRRKADRVLQQLALLRLIGKQDNGQGQPWTWHLAEQHSDDMHDGGWLDALKVGYGKSRTCLLCAETSDGAEAGRGGNVGQTTEADVADDLPTDSPLSTHLPVTDDFSAMGGQGQDDDGEGPF